MGRFEVSIWNLSLNVVLGACNNKCGINVLLPKGCH